VCNLSIWNSVSPSIRSIDSCTHFDDNSNHIYLAKLLILSFRKCGCIYRFFFFLYHQLMLWCMVDLFICRLGAINCVMWCNVLTLTICGDWCIYTLSRWQSIITKLRWATSTWSWFTNSRRARTITPFSKRNTTRRTTYRKNSRSDHISYCIYRVAQKWHHFYLRLNFIQY